MFVSWRPFPPPTIQSSNWSTACITNHRFRWLYKHTIRPSASRTLLNSEESSRFHLVDIVRTIPESRTRRQTRSRSDCSFVPIFWTKFVTVSWREMTGEVIFERDQIAVSPGFPALIAVDIRICVVKARHLRDFDVAFLITGWGRYY